MAGEKPILFSAPMIRAIQDDRKTQTRRLIRGLPDGAEPATLDEWRAAKADPRMADPSPRLTLFKRPVDPSEADGRGVLPSGLFGVPCPYGSPGDRLWVREGFAPVDALGRKCSPKDAAFVVLRDGAQVYRDGRLSPALPEYQRGVFDGIKWRPSIHMPRWASRITLEVTAVRVERLQSITEADAIAEGVDAVPVADVPRQGTLCRRDDFAQLWELINGKRAPWASNPWVWVVEFRKAAA